MKRHFPFIPKCDTKQGSEAAVVVQSTGGNKHVLNQTIAVFCIFLVVGLGGYAWRSHQISQQSDQ